MRLMHVSESPTVTTSFSSSKQRPLMAALLLLAAMALSSFATPANAQNFENLDRLDSLVAASVGANRGEPGGPVAPIDRRLRLATCPQPPVVEPPRMNAATVSCPSIGWRIRVPLAMNGQAPAPRNTADFSAPASAPSHAIVVKKGDPVQLIAGNSSFTISRTMIADEDGAVGAMIRVRQDSRAAPVTARVESSGVVRIPSI